MTCVPGCVERDPAHWCDECRASERHRSRNALPRGAVVAGLQIGRVLGQGGFGITYLAHHPVLAGWRVVKEFYPRDLVLRDISDGFTVTAVSDSVAVDYERALDRFVEEARTLERLNHANVVRVFHAERAHNTAYFVMPFLAGETVQARHTAKLARHAGDGATAGGPVRVWTLEEVAALLGPLADALAFLHGRTPPVLHRDIKPGNLYLVRDEARASDTLLLLDFGAARQDLGRSQLSRVYTPGFAPPEQVTGGRQSPATDGYAVAATVYFLLTNTPPGLSGVVEPPSRLVEGIPQEVADALMAGLGARPEDRPPPTELLSALRRSIEGRTDGRRSAARLRLPVMAGGAALVALAAVAWWRKPQAPLGGGAGQVPPATESRLADSPAATDGLFRHEDFVRIEPGTFRMGGAAGEPDERPVRTVRLTRPFLLQKTEVTQAQWLAVMGNNPSSFPACGPACPVENISWADIQQFLTRLNARDPGKRYRLPTEAEWEYAARSGSTGDYGGTGVLDQMGWYVGNSEGGPHAVGAKAPNAWGLFDMHGNVWEWVADRYGGYANLATTDPLGPDSGESRVVRGGSWRAVAWRAKSASRMGSAPGATYNNVGFRLASDP